MRHQPHLFLSHLLCSDCPYLPHLSLSTLPTHHCPLLLMVTTWRIHGGSISSIEVDPHPHNATIPPLPASRSLLPFIHQTIAHLTFEHRHNSEILQRKPTLKWSKGRRIFCPSSKVKVCICPVRLADKPWLKVLLADLLREKNDVP